MCSDAFPTIADDSESIFLTSWLFALRERGTVVGRALRTDPILLSTASAGATLAGGSGARYVSALNVLYWMAEFRSIMIKRKP